MHLTLEGILCSGLGEGVGLVALDWVDRQFRDKLGFRPYPGTLNLSLEGADWIAARQAMRLAAGIAIEPQPGFCAAKCFAVLIDSSIAGAAVLPDAGGYPEHKLEIVAPVPVRQVLKLNDGDRVRLQVRIE